MKINVVHKVEKFGVLSNMEKIKNPVYIYADAEKKTKIPVFSVEAAYQACKTLDPQTRIKFARMTPYGAKRASHKITPREGWDKDKIAVMSMLILQRFKNNPEDAKLLLSTGEAELTHENNWGDTFWGTVDGKGHNMFGKILMRVRAKLAGKTPTPPTEGKKEEQEGNEKCYKCGGSGIYSWGTVTNGKPAHAGKCFRCVGKGYVTPADEKRNNYHDGHCGCVVHG